MDLEQKREPSGSLEERIEPLDLIGGPFAVLESDPGVFTSLTRKLGIRGLELVELYDIEPWAVDHLNPHGLIFCFMWHKDAHRPTDFDDPAAEHVWFANQLSDDACASHAILNVILNCPSIELGEELEGFRRETEAMSPVMKGLAVTNSPILRQAHNSLARPADIRGAVNAVATATLDAEKAKLKAKVEPKRPTKRSVRGPPAKRGRPNKTATQKEKEKTDDDHTDLGESYHFIGYVPAHGKVWELDGLKSGPLEVGELPRPATASSPATRSHSHAGWMEVVRPALRMKMEKYGGSADDGSNIRFSLLAIVDDLYQKASDELEFLKRDAKKLEGRLNDDWQSKVDQSLLQSSKHAFGGNDNERIVLGKPFSSDFGARRMSRDIEIMQMQEQGLIQSWEECVRNAMRSNVAVDDEILKGIRTNKDHVNRTFDYEPFFKGFISHLHEEGLLFTLLNLDENGKRIKTAKAKS